MTTATVEKKTYKTLTWQAVKKMATEMGVEFYSDSSRYKDKGLGLRLDGWDKTEIRFEGYERIYTDSDWTRRRFHAITQENLLLKLELWALKNGVTYELKIFERNYGAKDYQLRIVEKVGA